MTQLVSKLAKHLSNPNRECQVRPTHIAHDKLLHLVRRSAHSSRPDFPSHPFRGSSHGKSQTKLSISRYPAIAGYFLVTSPRKGVRLSQQFLDTNLNHFLEAVRECPPKQTKRMPSHSHAVCMSPEKRTTQGKLVVPIATRNPIGTLHRRVLYPQQQVENDEPGIHFRTGRNAVFPQTV